MVHWYIIFMLLSPTGEVLKTAQKEVSTAAECYGAEDEFKMPDNSGNWFLARCGKQQEL